MASDRDPQELTDEELKEEYREIVDDGVALGSAGMSIGAAVMEGSPVRRELEARGIDPSEVV